MLQIMKKNLLPLLMAVVALCSCSDEDLGGFSGIKTGEVIDFGVSAVKTRANYTDGIDSKQVRWEEGDVVRIYYVYTNTTGNVEKIYADYTVTPVDGEIGEHKELGSLVAKDANNQLKWAEGSGHKFYAVYPADNEITIDEKGVATFPINRDQKCTIRDNKSTESAYTYVAEPDDKNIYMVASATAGPQSGSVWLDFKPIMTTINVVVKGPLNTTENQVTPDVIVTGVSLISTIITNTNASKSEFKYDITNGTITGSASGTGTSTEQTETTFISVVNNRDGLNAIKMKKDETLVLTGFLPPMATTTAGALQRQVQIRVHTTGGNKTMTLEDATALLPSAKGAIKLPSMYTPITGSNWITPLDDDIYVSQLSIPGTHDAASKECTSVGRTQDLTIEEQLNMGIRAFDLRPTCPDYSGGFFGQGASCLFNSGNNRFLPIYHGIANCNITLADVFTIFNEWLNENKKEFIIVTCRWEEESNHSGILVKYEGSEKWSTFEKAFTEFLNNETYYPKKRRVEFKPDLTIGDMRSDYDGDGENDGKILIICRPSQGSSPDSYYTGTNTSEKAIDGTVFVTGWPANQESPYVQNAGTFKQYYEGASVGTFMCQDYYQVSDEALKFNLIKDLLNISNQSHINPTYKNTWFINHCSGYENGGRIELWPSVSEYATNARDVNQEIFKYLMGETTYNNEYFSLGSTGIMYLDFVGSRNCSAGNYLVYGDLLPQTIIDNNYKYRMKRKGE